MVAQIVSSNGISKGISKVNR